MDLYLWKSLFLRCWACLSLLNWIGALTLSLLLKLPSRELEPWFVLSREVALCHYKYTIRPCFEYFCHVWTGAPSCSLEMSDILQKMDSRTAGPSPAASLNPWLIVEMYPAYVFSVGITLVDVHLNWINWFNFLILEGGLLVILIDCMIFLSPFLDATRMSTSTVFFLTQLGCGILCL